jgi:sirohydrochlorin ferrochelatase
MNAEAILALVSQGISILPTLIQTGIDVTQRIEQLVALSKDGADGTATPEQIAAVRAQLDQDLADFNAPMA